MHAVSIHCAVQALLKYNPAKQISHIDVPQRSTFACHFFKCCRHSTADLARDERRHERNPSTFEPEPVLMQSGLEAMAICSFLHENMLDFIDGCAIEDAAGALRYFSDAGADFWQLCHFKFISICGG